MAIGSFSIDRIAAHGVLRRRPAGRARAAAVAALPFIALGVAFLDGAVLFAASQMARLLGAGG